jgi:hypothetical protein
MKISLTLQLLANNRLGAEVWGLRSDRTAVRLCGASKNREENKIRKCIHIIKFTYKKNTSRIFFLKFFIIFSAARVKQRYLLARHTAIFRLQSIDFAL